MTLFLFIMGTNFTTNISDAFLLTVSIYYPSGRRPWWPGEYIHKSRTRRAPLPKFYIQSLYTTLLLAPVVGRRSSEHSFWGGGSTKGASRGVHLPGIGWASSPWFVVSIQRAL